MTPKGRWVVLRVRGLVASGMDRPKALDQALEEVEMAAEVRPVVLYDDGAVVVF